MLIPIRCFTCGKVIANKEETYLYYVNKLEMSEKDALDKMNLSRYCCRRMIISNVNLIEKILNYNIQNIKFNDIKKL